MAYPVGPIDDYAKHISKSTIRRRTTWQTWGLICRARSQLREEKILKNGKWYLVIGTVAKKDGRN